MICCACYISLSFDPGVFKSIKRGMMRPSKSPKTKQANMFSALPNDIARHIAKIAINERNEDVLDQIRDSVARVMEFAATDNCGAVEYPMFDGSNKCIHVTKFDKNMLLASRGMTTLSVTFWLHTEEFELTKHTYSTPGGDFEEESDYLLFIMDKSGKYGDIVAEVFKHVFEGGVVY